MGEGDGAGESSEAVSEPPGGSAAAGYPAVFLSYASHDGEIANHVCQFLESHGVACWMAPRNVRPGAVYADAIVRAINEASALVLILSGSAMSSEHVSREVERAGSKHKQVVAFRIDAAALSAELEYFLSRSQWIDVPTLGMSVALVKLAEAVGRGSATWARDNAGWDGGKASGRASIHQAVDTATVAKRVLAVAAIVIGVGIGGALAVRFWQSKHGDAQAPAVAAISDKSIAVLPFADLSEKHDQEYFADGVAEEVLDRLAKVPGLRVVGHISSFQFKDKNADPARIGAALGVAHLLEGSVRKEGGRIRVAAKLVEARTGSQQWSDHFDADVVNILNVQDTIAAELARALQIAVAVDTTPRPKLKSSEALEAYLRGLQSRNRQSQESCEAAVADFQRALALDPLFAPAAIGLADAYVAIGSEGWLAPQIAFERAREAALLAQRLDPNSPAPHVQMAAIDVNYDWDWAGAERELQKAFSLGPRDTNGVQYAAELAAALGHWDEARQLGIEAIELDPLNPIAHITLGWNVYLHTGQLVEAAQSIRRGLQIAPKAGSGQYYLGETLLLQGRHEEALSEFKKETLDDGQLEGAAMVYFATGRRAESDAQLAKAIHDNGSGWPSAIARVYAYRGEKDHALEWLEKAYEMRDEDLYVIKGDPFFRNLESDPRFEAFLKKMNLPE
ncbi:MAG: TIR domain-containing protein [Steroidobacteraceae bacterium]